MFVEKKAGKLSNLTEHLNGGAPAGHPGIAHTRWATHGRPNDVNAHPHTDCTGQLALIHNGIIENYRELKDQLLAAGHRFTSETDTEVLAHLIEQAYDGDLVEAVRLALQDVRGAYAIGVMHTAHPDRIVGARMNVPLIVGLGRGEAFLASDVPAILEHTKDVVILQEGDIADVTADGVRIVQLDGAGVDRDVTRNQLEHRSGREGRLRPLHAEGDLRAAARDPGGAPGAGRSIRGGDAGRAGADRGRAAGGGARLRGRLRHRAVCGRGGCAPDPGVGRPAGIGPDRQRDALFAAAHRRANPGHQRQPVRRDGGHAGANPTGR